MAASAGILWKTRTAESRTGVQELSCDAAIESHSARDLLHVRAAPLAKIRHFVDESDLGREKSVGCVFDQLCGAPSGKEHRRLIDEQRPVKLAHHVARPLVIGANHDAIGMLEILNGGALAQKLRI